MSKVLKNYESFQKSFPECQQGLREALGRIEDSGKNETLPDDSILGLPASYAERLLTIVKARQGLGRIALVEGQFAEAEQHLVKSIDQLKSQAHSPVLSAKGQRESYAFLYDVYSKQGQVGRALVAKLQGDLLDDYLQSEGGNRTLRLNGNSSKELSLRNS